MDKISVSLDDKTSLLIKNIFSLIPDIEKIINDGLKATISTATGGADQLIVKLSALSSGISKYSGLIKGLLNGFGTVENFKKELKKYIDIPNFAIDMLAGMAKMPKIIISGLESLKEQEIKEFVSTISNLFRTPVIGSIIASKIKNENIKNILNSLDSAKTSKMVFEILQKPLKDVTPES